MNKLLLVSVVALSVGGCAMSERETNGALIGGAGGAVIGGVASHLGRCSGRRRDRRRGRGGDRRSDPAPLRASALLVQPQRRPHRLPLLVRKRGLAPPITFSFPALDVGGARGRPRVVVP